MSNGLIFEKGRKRNEMDLQRLIQNTSILRAGRLLLLKIMTGLPIPPRAAQDVRSTRGIGRSTNVSAKMSFLNVYLLWLHMCSFMRIVGTSNVSAGQTHEYQDCDSHSRPSIER